MHFGRYICSLLPRNYVSAVKKESEYAGVAMRFEDFMGKVIGGALILSPLAFLFLKIWMKYGVFLSLAAPIALIICAIAGPYLIFTAMADSKKRQIEGVLPDILLLISSNIKSGLTIDRAMLFSARPEFGIVSEHFKKAAFKIYGGAPVESALRDMSVLIKSRILERTIDLLVEGIKCGGSIAKLLDEAATDIRNTQTLQNEIKTTVTMYVMFIIIAGVIGAPILYAISTYMITAISGMWSQQSSSGMSDLAGMSSGASFIKFSAPASMNPEIFSYFAITAIVITTFFAGILISMIQTGGAKQGIKYIPVLMSAALAIYFVARSILWSVFSSMLGK